MEKAMNQPMNWNEALDVFADEGWDDAGKLSVLLGYLNDHIAVKEDGSTAASTNGFIYTTKKILDNCWNPFSQPMEKAMILEEAIEIVIALASESVIGDDLLANDPHLESERDNQQEAINTVEDFFTNNVFN